MDNSNLSATFFQDWSGNSSPVSEHSNEKNFEKAIDSLNTSNSEKNTSIPESLFEDWSFNNTNNDESIAEKEQNVSGLSNPDKVLTESFFEDWNGSTIKDTSNNESNSGHGKDEFSPNASSLKTDPDVESDKCIKLNENTVNLNSICVLDDDQLFEEWEWENN